MDLQLDGTFELIAAAVSVALGFVVAVWASQRAVSHAADLAAMSKLPRFMIGFTLLAIGTDLPEIANSIVSSVTGHGDLNVGDSVGSAATQLTLILGLLPILGAVAFKVSRHRMIRVGIAIVGALLLGIALMTDGFLSRLDALILLGAWAVGSALLFGPGQHEEQETLPFGTNGRLSKVAIVVGALGVVALATVAAVWGLTVLAEALEVPEYLLAFFVASIGTSLPELIVDVTAVRQGQREMAIGGVMGASFIDSTLSIAAGPLIAPVAVTASLAVTGSLLAVGATIIVVSLLSWRRSHDWKSGVALLGVYAAFYVVAFLVV